MIGTRTFRLRDGPRFWATFSPSQKAFGLAQLSSRETSGGIWHAGEARLEIEVLAVSRAAFIGKHRSAIGDLGLLPDGA